MSDEGTPSNIPNLVVKFVSADGTWRVAAWESKSLPRSLFLYLKVSTRRGWETAEESFLRTEYEKCL